MVADLTRPGVEVGIVGAGTMGRGIAQVMATGGCTVRLHDVREGAVADAIAFAGQMIDRAVERGRMQAPEGAAAKARLVPANALSDLASCALVVEVVVEEIEAKRKLFAALEQVVAPDCILATNTSSLSVTAIAAACKAPERVAGYHFFNPVPVLRVVEVVSGLRTAPEVASALAALARRFGHAPVGAKDSPGFLINHAGRGLGTEGLRIVAEGIATHAEVDDVLREGAGFALGPFELLDVIGLDVSHVVMEEIYRQFYDEPRFRPLPETRQRVAAGLYGRKTGIGFYRYDGGKKIAPAARPVPTRLPEQVWLAPMDDATRTSVTAIIGDGCAIDSGKRPDARSLCLFAPIGEDCTAAALAAGVEAERAVAVDTLFGLQSRRTLMTTPITDPDLRDEMHALLARDGKPVTAIHDSPGFIAQRVVATIVNIGCDIAQQRIGKPEDIDQAVRLGLAYPKGPLEWGDAIGPARVLAILDALHGFYRDPRYRPSPWLVRRARLGVSLRTPEN